MAARFRAPLSGGGLRRRLDVGADSEARAVAATQVSATPGGGGGSYPDAFRTSNTWFHAGSCDELVCGSSSP